jgi:hypothetical protein
MVYHKVNTIRNLIVLNLKFYIRLTYSLICLLIQIFNFVIAINYKYMDNKNDRYKNK